MPRNRLGRVGNAHLNNPESARRETQCFRGWVTPTLSTHAASRGLNALNDDLVMVGRQIDMITEDNSVDFEYREVYYACLVSYSNQVRTVGTKSPTALFLLPFR